MVEFLVFGAEVLVGGFDFGYHCLGADDVEEAFVCHNARAGGDVDEGEEAEAFAWDGADFVEGGAFMGNGRDELRKVIGGLSVEG